MTTEQLFSRFPPFLRDYIYTNGWQTFREVQLQAADVIFGSEDNLLLSSATASGKTEAAFFPILTRIAEEPSRGGVSVLYIAPLKSLINDQFYRIEDVLKESGLPVFHWHGDVSASHKARFLRDPCGILQITPESLESMLMNRKNDIPRLFADLRFVVLDEIHTLIGSDRGNQVLCLLSRIGRMIGRAPRRIGLSATVGEPDRAAAWLGAGTGRPTACPRPTPEKLRWRIGMEHFYIGDAARDQATADAAANAASLMAADAAQGAEINAPKKAPAKENKERAALDAGYEFLYAAVKDKKSLVFSNSREETEYVTATLRQIAGKRGEDDIFHIHHGNLSAALREDAERIMKDESVTRAVTCATVTMELGIDIGRLERVAQVDAPTTVSGFLQRLGRSGRRGDPPEMIMLFREEMPLPNTPLPNLIPWGLLRGIALVELYTGERFIEPPREKKLPFSLAFHQTLSILASSGELTPRALAERVLSLPPLSHLDREDYRALLLSMVENDYLEMTEEKGLIVGLAGERLTNNFRFYAVFKDSEDYTVRCGSDEIGTITNPPPVGDRFALAGRVWEVNELDMSRRLVFVTAVEGKMEISWPGDSGEIHTRVLEKMREVLLSEKRYPYLLPNAAKRLDKARHLSKNTGMDKHLLIPIGGQSYVLFPWLGTRAFRTLRRFLKKYAAELGIADVESEGCCFITFKATKAVAAQLFPKIADKLKKEGIDPESLIGKDEMPIYDKFDDYIPPALLRRAYAADRLAPDEVVDRILRHNFCEVTKS